VRIGSRIVYPEEVTLWDMEIVQISVYKGWPDNIKHMKGCVEACRDNKIPFVIHPVGYNLLDPSNEETLILMAELSDESLIVHDELSANGGRLTSDEQRTFTSVLNKLREHGPVSIENAADTSDVHWFWDTFADSITLDLGHMESAGLDSVDFVSALSVEVIEKTEYVHIHRNGEFRNGLTDHWYLLPRCRELSALKTLAARKSDVSVILEINELEKIGESLSLLLKLRTDLRIK